MHILHSVLHNLSADSTVKMMSAARYGNIEKMGPFYGHFRYCIMDYAMSDLPQKPKMSVTNFKMSEK